jgi:hypothetical protein
MGGGKSGAFTRGGARNVFNPRQPKIPGVFCSGCEIYEDRITNAEYVNEIFTPTYGSDDRMAVWDFKTCFINCIRVEDKKNRLSREYYYRRKNKKLKDGKNSNCL